MTHKKLQSSLYIPKKDTEGPDHFELPCCFFDRFFSVEECDEVVQHCENTSLNEGKTFGANDNRRSDIGWLYESAKPTLFSRVMDSAFNSNYWGYDIYGFSDPAQYTTYDSSKYGESFYNSHKDTGPGYYHRKLSMVVLLSDPSEFEGGDFSLEYANHKQYFKNKGDAILFPSILHHGVSPVYNGIRRSLVFWISGPKLR
jgi:PKHD-type hydroxylase